MAGTCKDTAKAAESSTATNTWEYKNLSALMCWDAVMHCALLAGVIDEKKYRSSMGKPQNLATMDDLQVKDKGAMTNLESGHAIVFYENQRYKDNIKDKDFKNRWVPIHAMISLGGGRAAGTKNQCIGIGQPGVWEALDLGNSLKWQGDQILAQGKQAIHVYHREITRMS